MIPEERKEVVNKLAYAPWKLFRCLWKLAFQTEDSNVLGPVIWSVLCATWAGLNRQLQYHLWPSIVVALESCSEQMSSLFPNKLPQGHKEYIF